MGRLLLSALLVAALLPAGCESRRSTAAPPPDTSTQVPEVKPYVELPGGHRIELEIAADEDLRAQGLMFRESLARGRGMLFLFPETDNYPFWMKNTKIPLDMIWIDEAHRVVAIHSNVPPCLADPCPSYDPKHSARFVLELAGKEAEFFGLKTGDTLVFSGIDRFHPR